MISTYADVIVEIVIEELKHINHYAAADVIREKCRDRIAVEIDTWFNKDFKVSFDSLEPGAVWECPTTHERFIKTELTEGFNCVRLSDGKLMNRVLEWGVIPHLKL